MIRVPSSVSIRRVVFSATAAPLSETAPDAAAILRYAASDTTVPDRETDPLPAASEYDPTFRRSTSVPVKDRDPESVFSIRVLPIPMEAPETVLAPEATSSFRVDLRPI